MKKLVISVLLLFPFILFSQQNSVLSSGNWYKISAEQTGIHKITYNDLISYGIDVENTDPRHLVLYGNPAGMLPENLDDEYYTDLQPMAIQVVGEENGILDPEDYILFYGQGPDIWELNQITNQFQSVMNIYSRNTSYFLTISNHNVKRIQFEQSTTVEPTFFPEFYDLWISHELDLVNPTQTGKSWLGEEVLPGGSISLNLLSENAILTDSNYIKVVLASNSTEANEFSISINGELLKSLAMPISSAYYVKYKNRHFDTLFVAGGENTEISFVYNSLNDTARAWIDYFDMEMRMAKTLCDNQMPFRSRESVGIGEITQFNIESNTPGNIIIWNVTDPLNVKQEELTTEPDNILFRLPTDNLLEFYAFNGNDYYSPEFIGQIENQDLHGIIPPELLIITHPNFMDQANQVAEFHGISDGISVATFTIDDIYNEFSSGSQDITAIRNFVRYLKDKPETNLRYLLLFGDASYDYLDRTENNTNFVPTWESLNSTNIISSFASDYYFGVMDMEQGGELQVAVGRMPVSTQEQAEQAVNKIQSYYSAETMGAWENEMMFIADDGDNNRHSHDAEILTESVDTRSPVMNITKCYLDFFNLVQTDEGPRYPEVNETIENKTNDGVFYVNYTGHGYDKQLANENILSIDDLATWDNANMLPLWVIAACNVAHFDNPAFTSLGEMLFLKENAGAIAVISATRNTYASSNLAMNLAIIEKLTDESSQMNLCFGDLLMFPALNSNALKWTLLGDPALRMHFPAFNVKTISVNGFPIDEFADTISPGSNLTLTGMLTTKDEEELPVNFDGTIYLKVFAPKYLRSTLANQESSYVEEIVVQDSILTEGMAEIENGEFEIQLLLPANYYEGFGNIKLSWYAKDVEANGYNNQLVFGGEPDAIPESDEFFDQVKVYPTVFSNYLNIEMPLIADKNITYRVYNSMGVEMHTIKSKAVSGTEIIQVPGLSKGMYILNMNIENMSRNYKLFKY